MGRNKGRGGGERRRIGRARDGRECVASTLFPPVSAVMNHERAGAMEFSMFCCICVHCTAFFLGVQAARSNPPCTRSSPSPLKLPLRHALRSRLHRSPQRSSPLQTNSAAESYPVPAVGAVLRVVWISWSGGHG
jgi:hypothetical protein